MLFVHRPSREQNEQESFCQRFNVIQNFSVLCNVVNSHKVRDPHETRVSRGVPTCLHEEPCEQQTFTKYSRIFGQEMQTSRSAQKPTMKPSIHHEVLTIYPAGHPSRSTHVVVVVVDCLLLSKHPSRSTHECCLSIHHEVLKFALQSAVHPSRSTHVLLLSLLLLLSKAFITKSTHLDVFRRWVLVVQVAFRSSIHTKSANHMRQDSTDVCPLVYTKSLANPPIRETE